MRYRGLWLAATGLLLCSCGGDGTTASGNYTRVLRFDDRNATVQLGGSLNGATALGNAFTVEATVKVKGDGYIWQQWTDSDMNENFRIRDGKFEALATGGGAPEIIITGDTVPLNTWTHLAWVYNGAETRLYRDGRLVTRRDGVVAAPVVSAEAAAIGKNSATGGPGSSDVAFAGDLAAFRISTTARYTGDWFVQPTGPWNTDTSTAVLLDPTNIVGSPTAITFPGTQALTGTLGGGGNGATSPTWETYVP